MRHPNDHLSRLTRLFVKAARRRERRLAGTTLQNYLEAFLAGRETLLDSARRFGTPQYYFDRPALDRALAGFRDHFSRYLSRNQIFYAMKSNPFPGLCRRVVSRGFGLDVSSSFELGQALETGCTRIIFSGPGKTTAELELACRHRDRVTLQVDSFGELGRISRILEKHPGNGPLSMGVRVHSQDSWSKFGIPLKDLSRMLKQADGIKGLNPCGLQFHASWNLNPSAQTGMIDRIGAYLASSVPRDLRTRLRFLDIGGGFWPETGEWLNSQNTVKGRLLEIIDPQARLEQRHYHLPASPLAEFAREISESLSRQPPPVKDLEIWMEPGRWISNSAMHILLRVVDKKDRQTVITDGGINLLGWERPLSEFIPVLNLTRPSFREIKINVYGSLCTPLDVWGHSVFGEGIEEGDVLLVPDQGAYTYSLQQSFIKPKARVVQFSGRELQVVEQEEKAYNRALS